MKNTPTKTIAPMKSMNSLNLPTSLPLNNQPIPSTPSTGSITLIDSDHPETVLDQLCFVESQLKGLLEHKEHLLDQLSEASDNGLLDDYRNIGNEKQIVWEGLTLTHASRSKKVYADEIVEKLQAVKDSIAEEIKLIEYEATRRRQFTKKITEYWTLKLGAQ
jgi:hypothetical protein